MIQLWAAGIFALALAGAVHIVAVQTAPSLAPLSIRDRLAVLGPELQFHRVPPDFATPDLDPAFRYSVCLFDLANGPAAFETAAGNEYWGLSFHDRRGGAFYAINTRSAEQGRVTLILSPLAQAGRISRVLQDREDAAVLVRSRVMKGYAVLKVMAPSPSRSEEALERLSKAWCRKYDASPPPPAPPAAPRRGR